MSQRKKSQPLERETVAPPNNIIPLNEQSEQASADEQAHKFKPDDDQIALELLPQLKDRAAFFYGTWRIYDGGVWGERDGSEMRRFVRKELRAMRRFGVNVSQNRIRSIASMLEDDLYLPDRAIVEQHEERKKYVPLRNGLFNLETMCLEPHRPDLRFTYRLDFDFDENASAPHFIRYLQTSLVLPGGRETDHDLVRLVKQALGYSLTARTDLKTSFWLVGAKDSGKSTLIALLKNMWGALYGTIDLNQLGTNRFLLAGIAGKRVIAFTEATGNTVLPDALYKALVGGSDEIYADVKNRDPITFKPEAKVWWGMNEMPRIVDRSGATTRRIIIIPFNRSIPENERIANLDGLLLAERSGIFNHALLAYQTLLREREFSVPQQSADRRAEYIYRNDTEAIYLSQRCERHEQFKVRGGELYADYAQWCERYGFKPKSIIQVGEEWERLGLIKQRSNGSWWNGAQLLKNPEF